MKEKKISCMSDNKKQSQIEVRGAERQGIVPFPS